MSNFLPPVPRLSLQELGTYSERIQSILYEYISQSYFREGPPEDENDLRERRYSPEQCGLCVFFLYGRWFAKWRWPAEDKSIAPDSRTEVVRLDLGKSGELMQYEVGDDVFALGPCEAEAQAALARDEPVVSFAAGETPRAFSGDPRGLAMLVAMVRERVAERGGCILDLQEFGLSPETVREVAKLGRLVVSVGVKAVFCRGEREADALQGEREDREP